ncbi:MAG: Gfo/Idh/MocA family protein [Candidatus Binatia bacterium]
MPAPIPVGLIGAGKHGERYLRHIVEDVPELRLALLCRQDARAGREQAAQAGARYVGDFRELVASPEIAAVIAVVPPVWNVEICTLAASSGKAILVEKPLAVTVDRGLEIHDEVRRAGVPLMVGHTLRFNAVVRTVRSAIERIAPIHQLWLSQRFEPSRLAWLDDPAMSGGGNVIHTGVHGFDLLRHFTGRDPHSVFAATSRVTTTRTEDNFVAVFAFPEPLVAGVAGSRATASRSGAIEISGERGQIVADHVGGFATLVTGLTRTALDVPAQLPSVREALRAFARSLHERSPMPITLEDGLWAVAMAEACYRSIELDRAVPVRRL